MKTAIKFKVSKKVQALITKVAVRYLGKDVKKKDALLELEMDLTACHCNDVRLDFERLLKADISHLMHDVGGIQRHLDRSTGKLTCCFLPRYTFNPGYVNTHIKKPKVRNPYLPTPQDHAAAILAKKRNADALAGEPEPEQPDPEDIETDYGVPVTNTVWEKREVANLWADAHRKACPRSGVRDVRRKRD